LLELRAQLRLLLLAGGGKPAAHQATAAVAVALHSIAVETHLRRRLAVNAVGGGAVVAAVELSAPHHLPGLGGIGHQHRGQQRGVRVLKAIKQSEKKIFYVLPKVGKKADVAQKATYIAIKLKGHANNPDFCDFLYKSFRHRPVTELVKKAFAIFASNSWRYS
jgi:hypothetical protein